MAPEASERLVFVSTVTPGRSALSAFLLAESIRRFAGRLSQVPIWLYVTPGGELPKEAAERLRSLGVELVPFPVKGEAARFFFLPEAMAAADAEARVEGEADVVAWLGSNTIILREPSHLLLPPGKRIGYRPVHITNVGSPVDRPLDAFWSLIYKRCGVVPASVFPMRTHVDGATVRPYFNAGCLAVRPSARLLQAWRDRLVELHGDQEFATFLTEERYRIFMHQAVLSGVILAGYGRDELLELPSTYNYPSHLHGEDITVGRPEQLDGMVSIRHEGFFRDPYWEEAMQASKELKDWIRETLVRLGD